MKRFPEYMKLLGLLALAVAGLYLLTTGVSFLRPAPEPTVIPNLAAVALPQLVQPKKAPTPLFHYIEIMDGCDWSYTGTCVNMRSGPGESYPVVGRLRTGVVLKVEATTTPDHAGHEWYKVVFDGEIRYPERVTGDWYVAADAQSVRPFTDAGDKELIGKAVPSNKLIIVNLTEETLYAYEGNTTVMSVPISTGLELTPTPRGVFTIYRKTPSRYMQGPIPEVSDQYYDLPGVPWNLYFTVDGAVIHGAYWHNSFGKEWSHGCVNLPPDVAHELYEWADVGTKVIVRD